MTMIVTEDIMAQSWKILWKVVDWVGLYIMLVMISAVTFALISHGTLTWMQAIEGALIANVVKTILVKVHHRVVYGAKHGRDELPK